MPSPEQIRFLEHLAAALDPYITGGGGGATDPEIVRDTIGSALVAGTNIAITVNDPANTITIAVTGLAAIATSGSASDLASGTVPVARLPAATTTAIGAVELATDGEVAVGLAVQANDGRLSNARTPTAHATSHDHGGADALAVFGASTQGVVPASGGGTTNFLRADGTFAAPPGGSGLTHPQVLARGLGA